jgi:molybdopterin-binding protein
MDANERRHQMEISARNQLGGTVKNVEHGAVNSEVTIELSNGIEIVSIITRQSAEHLQLTPGKVVYAVIKATDVMIATE